MVAHNPLHISRRAALPHRAPALGSDGEASPRVGMADTRRRKPAVDDALHPLPWEVVRLTAAPERAVPESPLCVGRVAPGSYPPGAPTDPDVRD